MTRPMSCSTSPPLIGQRQAFGRFQRTTGQTDQRQQRPPPVARCALFGEEAKRQPGPGAEQTGVSPAVAADEHVVEHAQAGEQANVLEGAGQPQPRTPVRRQVVEGDVAQPDAASVGGQDAAHAVEQRGLAGSVGSDQGVDGVDLTVEAVQDSQTTEGLRDAAQLQQGHARP